MANLVAESSKDGGESSKGKGNPQKQEEEDFSKGKRGESPIRKGGVSPNRKGGVSPKGKGKGK